MINRFGRFFLYASLGLVVLFVIGMLISLSTGLTPAEVKSLNSIEEWMAFRLMMYAAVLVLWVPICKGLTLPKVRRKNITDEERAKRLNKREEDIAFLKSYWWKILLLFAFFEIVFIQQFGL